MGDRQAHQTTLSEQTYRNLRQLILDGAYRPSERLVETDLAETLKVSRTNVRSALQRLHQEGLVTFEPRRGAKVTAITLEEALEIVEVREGLEGFAASLAAVRASDKAIAELETIIEEMNGLLGAGKLLEYSEFNARFHRIIIASAANRKLKQMIDSLQISLVRYRFRTILFPGRNGESFKEHRSIFEGIRARSPEWAEFAMRKHIAGVGHTMASAGKLMEL